MATNLELIEEILLRPSEQYYSAYPNFNSRTLQGNWEAAMGVKRYYNSVNFEAPFFKQFWKVIKHLTGRNNIFKTFIETWYNLCKDHSSTAQKIEQCDRLKVGLPSNTCGIPTNINQLNNCTRLYYIASGINNIPNTPSDQDITQSAEPYIYKADESHKLQKALIKLRAGDSITTKIFKDKLTEARIIYFNKYDALAVAYLQIYTITTSWKNYLISQTDKIPNEIANILDTYLDMLRDYITETTYTAPLKNDGYINNLYINLKKIEDDLLKINQSDDILETFTQTWQERIKTTEKNNTEADINRLHADAKRYMDSYYDAMERVRVKQKILRNIVINDQDQKFLLEYMSFFKNLPNTLFHKQDSNRLYCLYEAPFANTDFAAMKTQIKDIPEDMTPIYESNWRGSYFAQEISWAINENQSYWPKQRLIKGYKDKEYWPAFIRATKKLLMDIFVERKITMYLSVCLYWNIESNTYQPSGVAVRDFPIPFQPLIKQRLWHPHMTHYNCWSVAQSEITKALSNRDPQTAFEYTMSASGQISFPETAGSKVAGYIWGNNKGYFDSNAKNAAENMKVYQRPDQPNRETLYELLSVYIRNELKEIEPEPIPVPKPEIKINKSLDERLTWLEAHHFIVSPNALITQIPSETDTRFQINGNIYIFLPSGDFLSMSDYEKYRQMFPDAPISIPFPTIIRDNIILTRPQMPPAIFEALTRDGTLNIARIPENNTYVLRNGNTTYALPENEVQYMPNQIQNDIEQYNSGHFIDGDNFDITEILNTPNQTTQAQAATATPNEILTEELIELARTVVTPTATEQEWERETEPTPEPPLRYINLILSNRPPDETPSWMFPRAAELPNGYHDFNEFRPEFNIQGHRHPATEDIVQYDVIEDTISYERDGTRHIIATNILNQLRGELPF